MPILITLAFLLLAQPEAPRTVSFPTGDGGVVFGDLYGGGAKGLVLAHGGRFNKESWRPQALEFAAAGYSVLALDFRGFGKSHGPGDNDLDSAPFQNDVLAAVRYLRAHGAASVDVVGGSLGGAAAGDACIEAAPGEIDRIVMLGAAPGEPADKLKCPSLFIVARDDANDDGPRLPGIQRQFDKAPQPKKLIILSGSAHAQYLFQTAHSASVMREILGFLSARP